MMRYEHVALAGVVRYLAAGGCGGFDDCGGGGGGGGVYAQAGAGVCM